MPKSVSHTRFGPEDLGVVAADAAVGVHVVRVEESPIRRAGGNSRAALVLLPVLEGEGEAVVDVGRQSTRTTLFIFGLSAFSCVGS